MVIKAQLKQFSTMSCTQVDPKFLKNLKYARKHNLSPKEQMERYKERQAEKAGNKE